MGGPLALSSWTTELKIPTVISQPSPQRSLQASSSNHHSTEFHTCVINHKHANPCMMKFLLQLPRQSFHHSDQKDEWLVPIKSQLQRGHQSPAQGHLSRFVSRFQNSSSNHLSTTQHASSTTNTQIPLMLKFLLQLPAQSFHSDQKEEWLVLIAT